jgi:uncharacterized protein YlzI (FlbEa/FlbD family)
MVDWYGLSLLACEKHYKRGHMACFITLNRTNGENIVINLDHVISINQTNTGTTLTMSTMVQNGNPFTIVVKQSIDEIRTVINDPNSSGNWKLKVV